MASRGSTPLVRSHGIVAQVLADQPHRLSGTEAPCPSPSAVLRMATEHGAGRTPFAGRIGQLRPGMAADLVILDWKAITWPHQSADISPVDVLVQRAKTSAVRTVMSNGDVVYRDGCFTRVDREAVLAEIARCLSRPLIPHEEKRRSVADAVLPIVSRFYQGYLACD
ncbi:amidohydrolase family protein [Roseomonas populi]|uniref:Amidohydrolase family protein n=1 Tax=Roseomonas populi TaxID=3121582 RepID=A0ABT1X6M9_9PROT|nr:amidohydrolase family protein [Roseomonas pecuniae]MCR0983743.1 amidohydrolase family protein [Roseomonas pecuniae]